MKECYPSASQLSPIVCFFVQPRFFAGSTPQVANVNPMISTLFTVLTLHCTFKNVIYGVGFGTIWRILGETNNLEEFATAFKEVVLPFGNWLLAISEGSIRFTLQAENISALEALWQSYQDETLQKNVQKFLVTEEIKLQAGGEVTLTVHIDEKEYRNAMWDFIRSETEGTWT